MPVGLADQRRVSVRRYRAGEVVCEAAEWLKKFVDMRDMKQKDIETARKCIDDLWELSTDLDEGFEDEKE